MMLKFSDYIMIVFLWHHKSLLLLVTNYALNISDRRLLSAYNKL